MHNTDISVGTQGQPQTGVDWMWTTSLENIRDPCSSLQSASDPARPARGKANQRTCQRGEFEYTRLDFSLSSEAERAVRRYNVQRGGASELRYTACYDFERPIVCVAWVSYICHKDKFLTLISLALVKIGLPRDVTPDPALPPTG